MVMRVLQTIIFATILICLAGCGKYILKSKIQENFITKEEVQKNYILKSEVLENYIPKSEVRAFYAPIASDHKCRYRVNAEQYFDFCFPYCPQSPYITDLGVPCP